MIASAYSYQPSHAPASIRRLSGRGRAGRQGVASRRCVGRGALPVPRLCDALRVAWAGVSGGIRTPSSIAAWSDGGVCAVFPGPEKDEKGENPGPPSPEWGFSPFSGFSGPGWAGNAIMVPPLFIRALVLSSNELRAAPRRNSYGLPEKAAHR